MCGIVGVWGPMGGRNEAVRKACGRLHHRGPDSQGVWEDTEAGITLGHVRLAILDLTEAGHQPMVSPCGRFVIVLNGEIYNHLELRRRLEAEGHAPAWRGHSDTETVLAAFAAWGVGAALKAMVGMFAIALWDRHSRSLTLMRDRLGEKPLYVGRAGRSLVFASEVRAFPAMPGFDDTVDRQALALLMRHNYIPGPFSIFASIRKLMPGCHLTIEAGQLSSPGLPEAVAYWSVADERRQGRAQPLSFGSDTQAVDALDTELSRAVQGQMLSDVPLGAFLSGGIDSSVIASLMQKNSDRPVRTFSIGFEEDGFDEAPFARAVASHLGTEHSEQYVNGADALAVVTGLAGIYDEPFADASQIPTVLVTRMAKQNVTVALSGDGGDELFGGYSRYRWMDKWWSWRQRIPGGLRPLAAGSAGLAARVMPVGRLQSRVGKVAELLAAPGPGQFYRSFVSYWSDPSGIVRDAHIPSTPFDLPSSDGFPEQMMLLDLQTYLPDDILVKVDRAAMASSLETRVPLLDHRVVEFAQRLPLQYKWRDGQSKWLLRQLLYRHVPASLIDRPKRGFSVPLGAWLRGPLRDWAEALLDPVRLNQQGLFHSAPLQQRWREHLAGRNDWSAWLWGVLMVQAWLDETSVSGSIAAGAREAA